MDTPPPSWLGSSAKMLGEIIRTGWFWYTTIPTILVGIVGYRVSETDMSLTIMSVVVAFIVVLASINAYHKLRKEECLISSTLRQINRIQADQIRNEAKAADKLEAEVAELKEGKNKVRVNAERCFLPLIERGLSIKEMFLMHHAKPTDDMVRTYNDWLSSVKDAVRATLGEVHVSRMCNMPASAVVMSGNPMRSRLYLRVENVVALLQTFIEELRD